MRERERTDPHPAGSGQDSTHLAAWWPCFPILPPSPGNPARKLTLTSPSPQLGKRTGHVSSGLALLGELNEMRCYVLHTVGGLGNEGGKGDSRCECPLCPADEVGGLQGTWLPPLPENRRPPPRPLPVNLPELWQTASNAMQEHQPPETAAQGSQKVKH